MLLTPFENTEHEDRREDCRLWVDRVGLWRCPFAVASILFRLVA